MMDVPDSNLEVCAANHWRLVNMLRVFISYRRDDSAGHAGRVLDRLTSEFGIENLFMDVDAIPLGVNFVRVIREEVSRCDVMLVVIGPEWLSIVDSEGRRRLDNPADFVRIEVVAGLVRGIPVVPLLIDGAKMPYRHELPSELRELPERMGLNVRHDAFHSDMARLIRGLSELREGKEYEVVRDTRRKSELLDWVRGFRSHHHRNPRIAELRKAFPAVPKTTAWRYCSGEHVGARESAVSSGNRTSLL